LLCVSRAQRVCGIDHYRLLEVNSETSCCKIALYRRDRDTTFLQVLTLSTFMDFRHDVSRQRHFPAPGATQSGYPRVVFLPGSLESRKRSLSIDFRNDVLRRGHACLFAGQSRCDPYSWSFHFMIPEFGGRLLMMTRVELITNFHSRVVS